MPTTKQLLEEFWDMGDRYALDLKDGSHLEGYILEITDEYVLFGLGGPWAPDEPIRVSLEEVNLGTLSYWDEKHHCYMDARWDEGSAAWSHTPYISPTVARPTRNRPWWKFWA